MVKENSQRDSYGSLWQLFYSCLCWLNFFLSCVLPLIVHSPCEAPFCGGNSVKATAGINFPKGDSEIKFKDDTVQMGESNGELAAVLCALAD